MNNFKSKLKILSKILIYASFSSIQILSNFESKAEMIANDSDANLKNRENHTEKPPPPPPGCGSRATADMHYVRWPPAVNFGFFYLEAPGRLWG